MKRYEDITLNHVRVCSVYTIDADIIEAKLAHKIKESDLVALAEEDAYQKRFVLDCFGRHEIWKMSCPATWWQHLKLALRTTWPRLFKRLVVHKKVVEFDSGWVCPDIAAKVTASRFVIPYVTEPSSFEIDE